MKTKMVSSENVAWIILIKNPIGITNIPTI